MCVSYLMLALLTLQCVHLGYSYRPIHDIYSTDHLDSLFMSTSGIGTVQFHTSLILYNPSCRKALEKHHMTSGIPQIQNMYSVYHDWRSYPRYAWYQQSDEESLVHKYDVTSCPTALFFRKDSTSERPTSIWTPECGVPFTTWVWDQVKTSVMFQNTLDTPVRVEIATFKMVIAAGKDKSIDTFPSHEVNVYDVTTDEQVGYYLIDGSISRIEITRLQENLEPDETFVDYMIDLKMIDQERAEERTVRMTKHAHRELLKTKQPLMVKGYTKESHKVATIPKAAYDLILNEYNNPNKKTDESCNELARGITNVGIPCIAQTLPDSVKTKVAELIRPFLETFCRCKLTFTKADDMIEFKAGNNVFSHVGDISSEVVSAVLHVYHDLDETPNWPMEVTGSDGIRRSVTMEPGDMIILESAKVISGRSTPFIGNSFVDVVFYFKPTMGWGFRRQVDDQRLNGPEANNADGNILLSDSGDSVPLHPLEENQDFWKKFRPEVFEGKLDLSIKDEL